MSRCPRRFWIYSLDRALTPGYTVSAVLVQTGLNKVSTVLLVKSRTGKDLLMLNGYTYYQHKHIRDGFRWSCTQMGSRSCRGFLHVTSQMMVVRAHTEHTHPPSTYFLEQIRKKYARDVKDSNPSSDEEEGKTPALVKIKSIRGSVGF